MLGVFLTLSVLGFGLVMFGRQNLEVVSDTVSHSFGRAFVTGLLGQILLLPTFGMLVVGLILSVAGILLLPFAVAVFAMLVVVGVVGGYLAVAHAMGETYTRRRMALGVVIGSPNSYRYLLVGLRGAGQSVGRLGLVRLGPGGRQHHVGRGVLRELAAGDRGVRRGAAQPGRHQGELLAGACSRPRRSPTNTSGPRRSSAFRPAGGRAPAHPREGFERAGSG